MGEYDSLLPHFPMVKKFMVATLAATLLLSGIATADEGTSESSSSSSASSNSSSSKNNTPEPEELRKREERLQRKMTNRSQNGKREDSLRREVKKLEQRRVREESLALNAVCIKGAVAKREDAHIAALKAFFDAKIVAHTTLRDALVNAWDLATSDERKAARKTAGQAFESAVQTARTALNAARKQAKNVFKGERNVCNAPTETEPDPSGNPGA